MDSDSDTTYFPTYEYADKTDKIPVDNAEHENELTFPMRQSYNSSFITNEMNQDSYVYDYEISPEIFSNTDQDTETQGHNESTCDDIHLLTESRSNAKRSKLVNESNRVEYRKQIFKTNVNVEEDIEKQAWKEERSIQSNDYNDEQNLCDDIFISNYNRNTRIAFHENTCRMESQESPDMQSLIQQNIVSTLNVTSRKTINPETKHRHKMFEKPQIISDVVIKQGNTNTEEKMNAESIQKINASAIKLNLLNKNDINFLNCIKYVRLINAMEWSLV